MIFGYGKCLDDPEGMICLDSVSLELDEHSCQELQQFLSSVINQLKNEHSVNWHRHCSRDLSKLLGCEIIVLKDRGMNQVGQTSGQEKGVEHE